MGKSVGNCHSDTKSVTSTITNHSNVLSCHSLSSIPQNCSDNCYMCYVPLKLLMHSLRCVELDSFFMKFLDKQDQMLLLGNKWHILLLILGAQYQISFPFGANLLVDTNNRSSCSSDSIMKLDQITRIRKLLSQLESMHLSSKLCSWFISLIIYDCDESGLNNVANVTYGRNSLLAQMSYIMNFQYEDYTCFMRLTLMIPSLLKINSAVMEEFLFGDMIKSHKIINIRTIISNWLNGDRCSTNNSYNPLVTNYIGQSHQKTPFYDVTNQMQGSRQPMKQPFNVWNYQLNMSHTYNEPLSNIAEQQSQPHSMYNTQFTNLNKYHHSTHDSISCESYYTNHQTYSSTPSENYTHLTMHKDMYYKSITTPNSDHDQSGTSLDSDENNSHSTLDQLEFSNNG